MSPVDIKKYLREGMALNIPGIDLANLVMADLGDRRIWHPVNPNLVQVLKWPRLAKEGNVELPSSARQETFAGWVISVGDECTRVQVGDQVTFLPLNFSRDESLTAMFRGREAEGTLDISIGYVLEAELDQMTRKDAP